MASRDLWTCSTCNSNNSDAFAPESCVFCSSARPDRIGELIDTSYHQSDSHTNLIDTTDEVAEPVSQVTTNRSLSTSSGSGVPAQRSKSESAGGNDTRGIKPLQRAFRAMSAAGPAYHDNITHYDKAFYDNWWKERAEAIARGEDPYARFRALVAASNERKATTKLKRMFSKEKSYTRSVPIRLDAEEEEEARKRDAAMMKQRTAGAGVR